MRYVRDNWRPLKESGQLEFKDANYEVVPGLRMETHAGHNRSMQCARLEQGGETLFGFADLVPTRAHLPFAWVMGYDLYPVETVEAFENRVGPTLGRIRAGLLESRTLAALRDTLLPKLISGGLRVKDVERCIGRAV